MEGSGKRVKIMNVTLSMAKNLVRQAKDKGGTPQDQLKIIQAGKDNWLTHGLQLEASSAEFVAGFHRNPKQRLMEG